MKVLVIGGTGYIGSHTAVELLNAGYEVSIIDNFSNSKPYVIERIRQITGKSFDFFNCDITDLSSLETIFSKNKFGCIIHFAAFKSGAESILYPGKYYHNNMDGLFNVVFLMKKYGVDNIIFSSSATVYGNDENVPIYEDHVIGNVISPYGFTKYLGELFLEKEVKQSKQLGAICLRYFNPIGAHPSGLLGEDAPDEIPNNLMLYTLKVANRELENLKVFGNDYNTFDGSGVRDFIHVVDVARGHVSSITRMMHHQNQFEVFNLGTGIGHSVFEFINTFKKVNNVDLPYIVVGRRPGDVEKSYASPLKANKYLNWKAEFNLEDCVRDSWNFYKKNH